MNPWDILAWFLIVIVALFGLAILFAFIFLGIVLRQFLRDRKIDIKKREHEQSLTIPAFEDSDVLGKIFSISYQMWRIYEVETDYDISTNKYRLRIMAESLDE